MAISSPSEFTLEANVTLKSSLLSGETVEELFVLFSGKLSPSFLNILLSKHTKEQKSSQTFLVV